MGVIEAVYHPGQVITVNDRMQRDYTYSLAAPAGQDFDPGFTPHHTPREMLEMGVFEGKYCTDCTDELPEDWFTNAKLSSTPDSALNYFGVKSRQPLSIWRDKGWIIGDDPRGWFQWYCRYYLGRRDAGVDAKQIKRWRAFARHAAQIRKNCNPGDIFCRPRQRQGLLQWAYDPLI
ncbi:hypothetical protein RXV86_19355 [Alisedimentitalea sp. MJ-SS2]|uniref:hypothetical protein n=1 Tax=Aliisedimentitalea sp. MJ-SS2 TaxID=3049795 RepID=UPI002914D3E1|nr:hypothetical protein [Alisedimentitalea sp. MJ-SS2]MDU8929553.1 hypothetical protein [Alisedimentitalea sp. MJ-SS2]